MAALLDGRRPSRQPRLRMACDVCHEAKTRCSGGAVCESCEDLAVPCLYSVAKRIGRPPGSRNKKHNKSSRVPRSETRPTMNMTATATNIHRTLDTESTALLSEAVSVVSCSTPATESLQNSPLHENVESIISRLPMNSSKSGCALDVLQSGSDPREPEAAPCTCLGRFMDLLGRLKQATYIDSSTCLEVVLQGVRQFNEEWAHFQLCHHCQQYPDSDVFLLMIICARFPLRQLKRPWAIRPSGDQPRAVGQATPLRPTFLGTYQMTAEEEEVVTNVLLKRALVMLQGILIELKRLLDQQEITLSISNWYDSTEKHGTSADAFPCSNPISPHIYGDPSAPMPLWTGRYGLRSVDRVENSIVMETISNDNFAPLQQMVALAITECQDLATFTCK